MVKRAHLQRDLGWGAAAIVFIAITAVRAGETDRFDTADLAIDLFGRRLPARRRHIQGPPDVVTVRCVQSGCSGHNRRAWDVPRGSDGSVQVERARVVQRLWAAPGKGTTSLASVGSATSSPPWSLAATSTTTASSFSSTATVPATSTTSTSSNRSPRS